MNEYRAKMSENGRIVIPAPLRQQMRLEAGEELILRIDHDELHVYSLKQSVKKAQALVRKYTKNQSLTKALKEMRKKDTTE